MPDDIPRLQLPMDSPRIRVHRQWFADDAAQSDLAARIRDIITGYPRREFALGNVVVTDMLQGDRFNTDEPRWHIDPDGNNWWLHVHPETKELHLAYRYGQTAEFWNALKVVIETLLR